MTGAPFAPVPVLRRRIFRLGFPCPLHRRKRVGKKPFGFPLFGAGPFPLNPFPWLFLFSLLTFRMGKQVTPLLGKEGWGPADAWMVTKKVGEGKTVEVLEALIFVGKTFASTKFPS
jgi:hypothetical protein